MLFNGKNKTKVILVYNMILKQLYIS